MLDARSCGEVLFAGILARTHADFPHSHRTYYRAPWQSEDSDPAAGFSFSITNISGRF